MEDCQVKLTCGHGISMENSLCYLLVWDGRVYWGSDFSGQLFLSHVRKGTESVRMDKAISSLPSGFLFQFLLDSLPLTFLDDRISPAIRNQINHFLPLSSFWSHVPHNRKAPRENGRYPALSLALFGWMPFDNIILFFGKFLDLTVTIWFSLS